VFVPEESSLGVQSALDLELNSISKWVSWIMETLGVKIESDSGLALVTNLDHEVVVVVVSVAVGSQAVTIAELEEGLSGEAELLLEALLVWSQDSSPVVSGLILVWGDSKVGLDERSNGLSSVVIGEPLLALTWSVLSHSEVDFI
jgi:hypothetical protein